MPGRAAIIGFDRFGLDDPAAGFRHAVLFGRGCLTVPMHDRGLAAAVRDGHVEALAGIENQAMRAAWLSDAEHGGWLSVDLNGPALNGEAERACGV